jgi:hypothetical protein
MLSHDAGARVRMEGSTPNRMDMIVLMMLVSNGKRFVRLYQKAASGEHAIMMRHQPRPNRHRSSSGCHASQHPGLVLRKSIEQSPDKHVAGHASRCVEVDLHWNHARCDAGSTCC